MKNLLYEGDVGRKEAIDESDANFHRLTAKIEIVDCLICPVYDILTKILVNRRGTSQGRPRGQENLYTGKVVATTILFRLLLSPHGLQAHHNINRFLEWHVDVEDPVTKATKRFKILNDEVQ